LISPEQVFTRSGNRSRYLSTNAVELSAQAEQLKEIIAFFKVSADSIPKKLNNEFKSQFVPYDEPHENVKRKVIINLDQPDVSDDEFERF